MSSVAEKKSIRERVEKALDSMRPYLKSDGGDVKIHQISDEGVVELELLGNCESCEMSHMTMKAGLEQAIKRVAPEVTAVKAINL